MNVTKNEIRDRQLNIDDYLQMVSTEQKEYAEMSAHPRIAENNDIIINFQTDKLMYKILHKDNLNKAFKKVKSNNRAGGINPIQFVGSKRDKRRVQKTWGANSS